MSISLGKEYLSTAIRRLKYYKELGEKTFAQLADNDFHYQPNSESNSIAVIIQHLYGNMLSRWTNFLTEDGEKSWRMRDDEFEVHEYSKKQLIELWDKGWSCFLQALESLTENELLRTIHIHEEPMTVVDAISRQLVHYPYHIGQILYIGRMIKDKEWKNLSIPRKKSASVETKDTEKGMK